MKYQLKVLIFLMLSVINNLMAQQKSISITDNFNKIIVSPHIKTILIKGTKPSIKIESIIVPMEKLQYEIKNNTLQVYLVGAKTITKNKKIKHNETKRKVPIYKSTVAKIIITYTAVETFSIRGEEKIIFESPLVQEKCTLRIYGESEVFIKNIEVDRLRVTIYGDSYLDIEKGNVEKQKITAYGESKVMAANVTSKETRITAYGDGSFKFNVSDKIKVNSYGNATIIYEGKAELSKGIVIGESTIRKI